MNQLLGEVEIELKRLDGEGVDKYTLKPTFEGLIEMERISGRTLAVLVNICILNSLGIKDVAAILYGGMVGKAGKGRPPISYEECGQRAMLTGLQKLFIPCSKIIGAGYTGRSVDEISAAAAKAGEEKKAVAATLEQ